MQRLFVLLIPLMIGCQQPAPQSSAQVATDRENVLEGVWSIVQANTVDPDGQTEDSYSQESLVIFTPGYYSFVWTFGIGGEARQPTAERWNATDAEKIEAYNSLIVNTGTYELTDGKMVTHPIAAKAQEFVGGGYSDYEYRVDGDTLYLTVTRVVSSDGADFTFYSDGGRNNFTLVRVE